MLQIKEGVGKRVRILLAFRMCSLNYTVLKSAETARAFVTTGLFVFARNHFKLYENCSLLLEESFSLSVSVSMKIDSEKFRN